jgi:potassium-transporting ATPase KdpC subunit
MHIHLPEAFNPSPARTMTSLIRPALLLVAALSLITGVLYPLAVTGVAQLAFAHTANGSIIEKDSTAAGSALIGQPFSDAKYFWPRPSATAPSANNALASSGSNLGPTNPALADAVRQRIDALRAATSADESAVPRKPIPVDLVTASASGLDPHISPAAAEFQIARVARARGIGADTVAKLVAAATEGRQLGVFGEPRVNVLRLNLALDAL